MNSDRLVEEGCRAAIPRLPDEPLAEIFLRIRNIDTSDNIAYHLSVRYGEQLCERYSIRRE
jgi:hypothetical protein